MLKEPISAENICGENHFYAITNDSGERSSIIESILARYEDAIPNVLFAQIQPDLIYPYQEGGCSLDARQKAMMVYAIAIQIARGKTTREYGISVIRKTSKEVFKEAREKIKDAPNKLLQLDSTSKHINRIERNALVEGPIIELIRNEDSELIKNLQKRTCYMFINTTNTDFVTSDEPVLVLDGSRQKDGLFDCPLNNWNSIVYYPLDPKHMIALYTEEFCKKPDNGVGNTTILGEEDKSFIKNVNMAQYKQCHRWLIAKEAESLKDLAN